MTAKEHIRLIWAVASKDLVDALKNKTILAIMIGVGMMMLSSVALGLISNLDDQPKAVYVDLGKSTLAKEITRSREIVFASMKDQAELLEVVGNMAEPILGLVIPADFDQRLAAGESLTLPAYYPHWVSSGEIEALVGVYETELSQRTGGQITIQTAGNPVYPVETGFSYPAMIGMGIVAGVMTIGLMMVPLLLIEEKETHTIDALLISPIRLPHLLLGKCLAGLSYSVAAALVILAFSTRWVVHWEVMALAVILGGLLAVAIGLLMGSLFEQVASVNMAAGLMILLLIFPVFLWPSIAAKLSPGVIAWAQYWPSLTVNELVMAALGEHIVWANLWPNIVVALACFALILALVGLRVRRLDR